MSPNPPKNPKKAKNSPFWVIGNEIKKFYSNQKQLRKILSETQISLNDVEVSKILPYELRFFVNILESQGRLLQHPTLVVIGSARARLVNFILGANILPYHDSVKNSSGQSSADKNKCWRWLRLQYAPKKNIRLLFGPDIEVLEPSLMTSSNWDQIPYKALKCNNASDLSTVMDVYLCHPLLEQGLQIIVPPDLSSDRLIGMSQNPTDSTYQDLLFSNKEESPLASTLPIILYAVDNTNNLHLNSKNIDVEKENVCGNKTDQRNSFNCDNDLYSFKRNDDSSKHCVKNTNSCPTEDSNISSEMNSGSSFNDSGKLHQSDNFTLTNEENQNGYDGLSDEDLLDLRCIYEIHPNSEVLFVLFDDAAVDRDQFVSSLTSYDGNIATSMSKKNSASEWIIVDDSKKEESIKSKVKSKDCKKNNIPSETDDEHCVLHWDAFILNLVSFTTKCLQSFVLARCSDFSEVNFSLLQKFIMSSYDMARQMQVIPKRIKYVAYMEESLYAKLLGKFTSENNLQELHSIIESVVQDMRDSINSMDWSDYNCCGSQEFSRTSNSECGCSENENCRFSDLFSNEHDAFESIKDKDSVSNTSKETAFNTVELESGVKGLTVNPLDECVDASLICDKLVNSENGVNSDFSNNINGSKPEIDKDNEKHPAPVENENLRTMSENALDLNINREIGLNSINNAEETTIENEVHLNEEGVSVMDFMGSGSFSSGNSNCANGHHVRVSFKQVSMGVQRIILAKLSRNISIRLVNYVDCLRNNYFGTLQRCLEALEENLEIRSASEAVRGILLVARSIDLEQCASFSLLNLLVDQVRRFFNSVFSSLTKHFTRREGASSDLASNADKSQLASSSCLNSYRWKKSVAHQTVNSLNASKLCKIISAQLKDRIRISHEQFQSALLSLSEYHSEKLHNTEELKIIVRKKYAPRFARLYLESMSLADLVKYGMPSIGKEIGRGHYGVVYTLKGTWAGCCPLAIKSVVPPDDKHFDELAMEYFQNRNIPPHSRIVGLVGSIVDYTYGNDRRLPAILLVSERLKWDLECAMAQETIPFEKRMQIAIDVVEGIRYLHSQGLVHRDIKMKNILLDENDRAKITDLGFCIPEAMISGSVVGTPLHMAPELLKGPYDFAVDVYAFGILFWFICSGQVQIPSTFNNFYTKEQLWYSVCKGVRPERLPMFSDACWDIMRSCWSGEPYLRPLLGDIQSVLEHARDYPNEHRGKGT